MSPSISLPPTAVTPHVFQVTRPVHLPPVVRRPRSGPPSRQVAVGKALAGEDVPGPVHGLGSARLGAFLSRARSPSFTG